MSDWLGDIPEEMRAAALELIAKGPASQCQFEFVKRIGTGEVKYRCKVCGYEGFDRVGDFWAGRIYRDCPEQVRPVNAKIERIRKRLKNRKPCNCHKGK